MTNKTGIEEIGNMTPVEKTRRVEISLEAIVTLALFTYSYIDTLRLKL
jgi:hypothetical protein